MAYIPVAQRGGGSAAPVTGGGSGGGLFADAKAKIANIESGGNYKAKGPIITNKESSYYGDRAYGKYQVMGKNVASWTKEALGKSLTIEQFYNSPEAQEKVFEHKFGSYVKQYGSERNAAKVWFGGAGALTNPNAKDVLGTSVEEYANKFDGGPGAGGKVYVSVADREANRKSLGDQLGMDIIPGQEKSVFNKAILANAVKDIKPGPMTSAFKAPGVTATLIKSIRPALAGAWDSFTKSEDERRATQTIGEEAYTELIARPAAVLKAVGFDFPRLVLGGMSATGKTVLEAVYTPIFGKEGARKPLFATKEEQVKAETFLFGSEQKTWQEIKDDVDEFTATSPIATDWEKKNLGLTIAVAGVMGDIFTGGGGKGKIGAKALKELIETSDEFLAKEILIKEGIPKDLASTASYAVAQARNAAEVDNALKGASKALLTQASASKAPKVTLPKNPLEAMEAYTRDVLDPARAEGKALVLDSDALKNYFGRDFDNGRHPIYSQATKDLFHQEVPKSSNPIVRLTSGGPASGKTDFVLGPATRDFDGVVYDSTLSDYKTALDRIKVVNDAGKEVEIYAILPDVEKARYFALQRAQKTGRDVPEDFFIKTHIGAPNTLQRLLEDGVVRPDQVKLVDTRQLSKEDILRKVADGSIYAEDPLALLRQAEYNEANVKQLTKTGASRFAAEMDAAGRDGSIQLSKGLESTGDSAGRGANDGRASSSLLRAEPPTYQQLYELERRAAKGTKKEEIDDLTLQLGFYEDAIEDMPGKRLMRYVSRATGELPEITGKATKQSISGSGKEVAGGEFTRRGDDILQEIFGAEKNPDWDMAQKAVDDYRELRDRVKDLKADIFDKRQNLSSARKLERISKSAMAERRMKIRALQDRYKLNDKDIAKIRGRRDISAMEPREFEKFMLDAEDAAEELGRRSEALIQLKGTIYEKELQKTENLRQAMELPPISQMDAAQLRTFEETLAQFKQGDEFLSVRKLETVDKTDLAGIKTVREAQERLLIDVNNTRLANGQKPYTIEELGSVAVQELDRYRYDPALARRNPVYQLMVEEKTKAFLNGSMQFLKIRDEIETLVKAARASRSRGVADRLIPTDKQIFNWLEADDLNKVKLAKDMTPEELAAGDYIRGLYAEARDYLVQQKVLKAYRSDYITHIRRGFLESWKDDGLVTAFREAFAQYKLDEAMFNILDQKTGDVLPLEKFFRFSMRRSGTLEPSKNVARVVESYFNTLEKKKALDSLVPKLDIYVHSLTPKKLTPRGLEFDDSLKRFLNEWLNSKKGRPSSDFIAKPGGKLDWTLRTGVAFTRLIDLGFAIPIGIASTFGEHAANLIAIGLKKEALGAARLATKQGRAIAHKYENFVGEPVLKNLAQASNGIGDKVISSAFSLFAAGTRNANEVFLLGSLTKEEFAAGAIDPARLAKLQLKQAKYRVVPDMESVFGKTAVGGVATQYKKWAVPLISATMRNAAQFTRAVKNKGFEDALQKEESVEFLRSLILTATIGFGTYGYLQSRSDKKVSDMSFGEEIAFKAARDSLSLVGALDPKFFTSEPRLMQFVARIGEAASQILKLEENKDGEYKGFKNLQGALTPAIGRQIMREVAPEEDTPTAKPIKTPAGLPSLDGASVGLPSLPGLPKL